MDQAMEIATRRSLMGDHTSELSLGEEKKQLTERTEVADAARGLADDPRIRILVNWIENLCQGWKGWNNRRVLIFTEYTNIRRYLEQQLRAAIAKTDPENNRLATFHGGMGDATRQELKQAFNGSPEKLIATDAVRSLRAPGRRAFCLWGYGGFSGEPKRSRC